jgi:glutathione S-transferase
MARILYDLAGADPALRFSPFCWRIRLALAHKGLAVETKPWRFSDKPAIAFSGQDKVPVLVDGERVVSDSWAIARYLDDAYPDAPKLFPNGAGPVRFIAAWADTVLGPAIIRFVLGDIFAAIDPGDRAYFRASREPRFGMPIEAVAADRDARLPAFRSQTLAPLRATLAGQDYLGGAAPDYADFAVFGSFMWPRCISGFELLAADDPVHAWRERMLDACGGVGRSAVRAAA